MSCFYILLLVYEIMGNTAQCIVVKFGGYIILYEDWDSFACVVLKLKYTKLDDISIQDNVRPHGKGKFGFINKQPKCSTLHYYNTSSLATYSFLLATYLETCEIGVTTIEIKVNAK